MKLFKRNKLKTEILADKKTLVYRTGKKGNIDGKYFETVRQSKNEYFPDISWTKSEKANHIFFDISGLTPVSEYIKNEISQEKYFHIISRIQKTAAFLSDAELPLSGLVCDTENLYIDAESGKVYLIYIPDTKAKNNSIQELIYELNKKANINISDGNHISRYNDFVNRNFSKYRKNKNSLITESEFLNVIENGGKNKKTVKAEKVSQNASVPFAYIIGGNGEKHYIDHVPFTLGRNKDTDVSLYDVPEISGNHARITFNSGKYFIEDCGSTNGTFLKNSSAGDMFDKDRRIKQAELYDGVTFYLYHTPFIFYNDCRTSQTCLAGESDYESAQTQYIDTDNSIREDTVCLQAYLSDENGMTIQIYSFPFSNEKLKGIKIKKDIFQNNAVYFIENISAEEFYFEGEKIEAGQKAELFSGGCFQICGREFKFFIKY